jgi:hypothetical protein
MWSVIANRTENQFQHRRVGLIAVFLHEYIAGMTITGVRSLFRSNFGLECSPLVAITTIRGHIPVEVSSDQSLYRFQVMGVPTYALTAYVSVSKTRPSQDVDQDLRGIGGGVVSKVFADCWATDLSGMRQ